jgi:hypothetical protein
MALPTPAGFLGEETEYLSDVVLDLSRGFD